MENIIQAVLQYENKPSFVTDYDSAKHHVVRWLNQFDAKYRDSIDATMDSILEHFFITKDDYKKMCISKARDKILTSNNPEEYWSKTYILDCQINGKSQSAMVEILKSALIEEDLHFCQDITKAENLLYFDDMAFTFGRIRSDIKRFSGRKLDICPVITHSYNDYYFRNHDGKASNIRTLYCAILENRTGAGYKNVSDVFWPHQDSLQNEEFKEKFEELGCNKDNLRDQYSASKIFKDPYARKICEEAFFIEGTKIVTALSDKKNYKPLGISPYENHWGFGGSVFSYRNCPNTAPLVIWWGSYYNPNRLWYPLMLRKGYNQ